MRLLVGFGVVVGLLGVVAATLYLNRRAVAQHVLVSWLAGRGIDSDVAIERFERDEFVARIRLGARTAPEASVEKVGIAYTLSLPWSTAGFGLELNQVRLQRPVIKAVWHDGKLTLGSIDVLLRDFLDAPASAAGVGPEILVEAAELQLTTDHGLVQWLADARIDDGRLLQLTARMPAASLGIGALAAQGLAGTVDLATMGDRIAIRLEAAAQSLSHTSVQAESARLSLSGELAYPDLRLQRADGPFALKVELAASQVRNAGGEARTAQITAALQGVATGDAAALSVQGEASVDLAASEMSGQGITTQDVHATWNAAQFSLARGPEGLGWSLASPATLAAGRFAFGELLLQQLRASLHLAVSSEQPGLVDVQAQGSLDAANGSWPLLGLPADDDLPDLVQMKRALRSFAIRAPDVRVTVGASGSSVVLNQPARLAPANGGALVIAPAARPVYQASATQPGAGALRLTATRGRGLPQASFVVPDWHFTDDGFEATLEGRAVLDFDIARGIAIETRGVLGLAGDRLSYAPRDCVALQIERIEPDENDATAIVGAVCPDGAPLFATTDAGWKVQGAFRGVSGAVPAVAMRFGDFRGKFVATSSSRGLGLDATLAGGQAIDTTTPARFNPLDNSGTVALKDEQWSGTFDLASGSRRIGRMTLAHDATTATGGVRIEVPDLAFAEGGLQPAQLSALAGEFVQSPATGTVRFEGRLDWAGEAPATSSGRIVIAGLDFASPAGAVKGLKGQIEFTSLTPLVTAPDQSLSVDRLVAATEVTGLNVVFALDDGALRVAAGELHAAGGRLFAMPFAIPLDLTQPFSGTLVIETLQVGKVLADAGLADKIALDAVVSGRLPFAWTPGQGLRIVGGTLAAVQPGRLTLKRELLAQVQTSAAAQAPPGLVEDLAYQAMENLSFETLSVDVNSLDQGRVGLVFRVKGRHDPPQHQELRVGLVELVTRRFMQRKLPLPSDTRIDLTLDTTLNLNQLISDLLEVQRARQGRGSTPAAPVGP